MTAPSTQPASTGAATPLPKYLDTLCTRCGERFGKHNLGSECPDKGGIFTLETIPAGAADETKDVLLRGATAMLDAIEREIPRNDADRDYADTVIQEFRSLRAKLNSAEVYIEELEDRIAALKAATGGENGT